MGMELRHLRYFVTVGEEQHFGRAANRLRIAQPALSRQIHDLEDELGFSLFTRLPCGVRISAAGKSFLEDARRILQEVNEAKLRAERVANGQSDTLRIGFTESASWQGVVPDSFRQFRRKQPNAELQVNPMSSLAQVEAVLSGKIDAGYVFFVPKGDKDLETIQVKLNYIVLAVPIDHPLTKLKKLRLGDLKDADFLWLPRRVSPALYDRLMQECSRGGIESPRIVQEAVDEATFLSLVSCRIGVAFVSDSSRWRCPKGVVLLRVTDLDISLPQSLIWRKDNESPLLAKFVTEVKRLAEVEASAGH
jgi:DNA-binding transcriptional LysR family regulator